MYPSSGCKSRSLVVTVFICQMLLLLLLAAAVAAVVLFLPDVQKARPTSTCGLNGLLDREEESSLPHRLACFPFHFFVPSLGRESLVFFSFLNEHLFFEAEKSQRRKGGGEIAF